MTMTYESMNADRRKILDMLAAGNISIAEADQLLGDDHAFAAGSDTHTPKFLRLVMEPRDQAASRRKVDIRVPLGLLRSGVQIARSIPIEKRGPMTIALGTHSLAFDLSGVDAENADEFMAQFKDLTTDINGKDETLRLFCE
jgi:hypothetical protein